MLNAISEKFHAWTTGWRVFLLFLAEAAMMGYIMPLAARILAFAANNNVLPLDLMFFYTPEQAFEMMDKYGEARSSGMGHNALRFSKKGVLRPHDWAGAGGVCQSRPEPFS